MMDPLEAQALLKEVSKSIQDIGRRVGSPKNDIDDLKMLSDALRFSAQTVDVTRDIFILHYEQ